MESDKNSEERRKKYFEDFDYGRDFVDFCKAQQKKLEQPICCMHFIEGEPNDYDYLYYFKSPIIVLTDKKVKADYVYMYLRDAYISTKAIVVNPNPVLDTAIRLGGVAALLSAMVFIN